MRRRGEAPAWEEFLRVWEALTAAAVEPGTVLVVEGERDRRALRRLGYPGTVVLVHRGATLSELTQALAGRHRRVILLTDWDAEGGDLARRLRGFLASGPARLDLEYRRRLARVLRGEVTHVEGLFAWARRMAERSGAPLDHVLAGVAPPPADGPTG